MFAIFNHGQKHGQSCFGNHNHGHIYGKQCLYKKSIVNHGHIPLSKVWLLLATIVEPWFINGYTIVGNGYHGQKHD